MQEAAPPIRNHLPVKQPLGKIVTGLSYDEYSRAEGINQSGLTQVLRSPAHYQHYIRAPDKDTPAKRLGRIAHMCILEPDEYARRIVITSGTRRKTTAPTVDQVTGQEMPDAVLVTPDEDAQCKAMRDAVWSNKEAARLLTKGQREASMWWEDPLYRVTCKARFDFMMEHKGKRYCVDLKTTTDASNREFAKSVVNYRYDLQAAHYLSGGKHSGAFDSQTFFFVVVEKNPPYATVVYTLSPALDSVGEKWLEEAMSVYADCVRSNSWPSLPQADQLQMPRWAKVPGQEELEDG